MPVSFSPPRNPKLIRTLHYAHRQVLQPSWPVSGLPKPGRVILARAPQPSRPPQSVTPGSRPDALAPTSGRPPLSCLPPQGAGSQLPASWFAPALKYPRDFPFPTAHSGRSPNTSQSPPRSGLLNAQRGRSARRRGACFPCGDTEDKQENAKSCRWAPAGRRQRARSGGLGAPFGPTDLSGHASASPNRPASLTRDTAQRMSKTRPSFRSVPGPLSTLCLHRQPPPSPPKVPLRRPCPAGQSSPPRAAFLAACVLPLRGHPRHTWHLSQTETPSGAGAAEGGRAQEPGACACTAASSPTS